MTEIYLSENHLMLKSDYSDPNMHAHRAAHLLVSLSGEIRVLTEDGEYPCRGVRIPSGCAHTIRSGEGANLVFLFDETTSLSRQITELAVLPEETAGRIAELYESLRRKEDDPAAVRRFMTQALSLAGLQDTGTSIRDLRILSAMHYVDGHLGDQLTEAEAAAFVGLSESRFSHLFSEQAGITFAGYVTLRRMYRVYRELAGEKSITEASLDAGFYSPSHFAAVNRKLFGLSAGEFRGHLRIRELPRQTPQDTESLTE